MRTFSTIQSRNDGRKLRAVAVALMTFGVFAPTTFVRAYDGVDAAGFQNGFRSDSAPVTEAPPAPRPSATATRNPDGSVTTREQPTDYSSEPIGHSEPGPGWDDYEAPPEDMSAPTINDDDPGNLAENAIAEPEEPDGNASCGDLERLSFEVTANEMKCPSFIRTIQNCKNGEYDPLLEAAEDNYISSNDSMSHAGATNASSASDMAGGDGVGAVQGQTAMQSPLLRSQAQAAACKSQADKADGIRKALRSAISTANGYCGGSPISENDLTDPDPTYFQEKCAAMLDEAGALSGQAGENADKLSEAAQEEGDPATPSDGDPTNTNGTETADTGGGGGDTSGGGGGAGDTSGGGDTTGGSGDTATNDSGDGGGFNPLALAPLAALPFLLGDDDEEETPPEVVEEDEEPECGEDEVLNDARTRCIATTDPPECEAEGMVRNESGVCVVADGSCGPNYYPNADFDSDVAESDENRSCLPRPLCATGEYFNVDVRSCVAKSCQEGETLNQNGDCEAAVVDGGDSQVAEDDRVLRSPVEGRGRRTSFDRGVSSFRR